MEVVFKKLAMIAKAFQYISNLSSKKFVRDVATVATGTITVQVIVIAASPFITRLYGPEAFGVLGIFIAMVSLFNPIATLTYSTAIVLPEKTDDAKGLALISLISAAIISMLIAIVLLLFQGQLIPFFSLESVADYLLLLPIAMMFMAIGQILHHWLIRIGHFGKVAKLSIYKAILANSMKVGAGFVNASASVLIFIASFGYMIHAALFCMGGKGTGIFNSSYKSKSLYSRIDNLKHLAHSYRNFPLYRAPQMFFNTLTKSLPLILLAFFFTPAAAGFYSISQRVLQLPASIIGWSIGTVYYPEIAKRANDGQMLWPYIKKATLGIAGIIIIPLIIIIIFGPLLFEFAFGNEWRTAGDYARWLSLLVFFEKILVPGKDAMLVLGSQKLLLLYEIFGMCFKVTMLVVGVNFLNDSVASIMLFSISGVLLSIAFMVIIRSKSLLRKTEYHIYNDSHE